MGVRTLVWAILCLLAFVNIGVLGVELRLEIRNLSISDIPSCGIQCLFLTVPDSGCDFADVECQCKNENLARKLSGCMLANCTMTEMLDTAKVQAELCHLPNKDMTHDVYLYTIIIFSIAVIFVTLRVAGKVLAKRLSADDWIIVTAMLLTAIPCGCVLAMTGIGFGKHLWNLQHGQLKQCLRFFYVSWSTYVIVLGLIKISLLMFYLQIFPSRRFRIGCYITLAYIIISTIVIYLATIFACLPIKAFWDRDVKGKCLDINALAYANSGSAIAQDIIILALPLSVIRGLKMKRYKKIAVGLMFSVGAFGCITTIVRLHTLLKFRISIDPTWDYVPVTIWTGLELGCGFVCASLPSIRILLTMILPKCFSNFLSTITHRSRSRSNRTGTPGMEMGDHAGQEKEKNGFSWMHVPTSGLSNSGGSSGGDGTKASRNFPSSLFSRWRGTRIYGSHRLDSTIDQLGPDIIQAATINCTRERESAREQGRLSNQDEWEQAQERAQAKAQAQTHLQIPRPSRQFCPSCGSEGSLITALPQIGCLPDGSYSRIHLAASDDHRDWDNV